MGWWMNTTSTLWWEVNIFSWIKKSEACGLHGRGLRTLFSMKSWYLVFSVLGNGLVEVLINLHILLSKKGKAWNTFSWRKPDQLLVLYVNRLLLPTLLCFKRRLKEHKRLPKLHSESTAKLTQALYFCLVCPASPPWRAFSTSTPYMAISHGKSQTLTVLGSFQELFFCQNS